jgi:predicted MFS family arabinose efflux permease
LFTNETAAGAPLGAIFGNLVAGIVAQFASWKWVFGVIAICSALVALAGIFVIPATPPKLAKEALEGQGVRPRATVDWLGGFLVTMGLFALLFALTEGNVVGWSTPWIPALIVVSMVLLALFVAWQAYLERRLASSSSSSSSSTATSGVGSGSGSGSDSNSDVLLLLRPLMKVSMFRRPRFAAAMLIMALMFSSFNGYLVYATYFFQDYQGLSPLQTTLRFVPTGVCGALTALACANLLHVAPTWMLLLFGNVCVSLASLLFALPLPRATSYFAFGLPAMVLSVFGADTTWPTLSLFTSHALPHEDQALGGALVNAMGQVGRAIGLAVATALQTAVMARERRVAVEDVGPVVVGDAASLAGLRAADWFNFATGVVSVLVVGLAFRGSGIVGKAGVDVVESAGKDGVVRPGSRCLVEETAIADEEAATRTSAFSKALNV